MYKVIGDEYKSLILLSSLLDERFETFVLSLINGKSSLSYNEVTIALVNLELRRKDKESFSSTPVEVLVARGRSSNKKGENHGRSRSKSKVGNREGIATMRGECHQVG